MNFEQHWLQQLEQDLKNLKEDNRKEEKKLAEKIKQYKKENKGFL